MIQNSVPIIREFCSRMTGVRKGLGLAGRENAAGLVSRARSGRLFYTTQQLASFLEERQPLLSGGAADRCAFLECSGHNTKLTEGVGQRSSYTSQYEAWWCGFEAAKNVSC